MLLYNRASALAVKYFAQVVSDRDERFQAYTCLKLSISELCFSYFLESVDEKLFFFALSIYTHFIIFPPPFPAFSHKGTTAGEPRLRNGAFVLAVTSHLQLYNLVLQQRPN